MRGFSFCLNDSPLHIHLSRPFGEKRVEAEKPEKQGE